MEGEGGAELAQEFGLGDAIDSRPDREQLINQEYVNQTFLSIRLQQSILDDDVSVASPRFSWANPHDFINAFVNENPGNPVPVAIEQTEGVCIPCSFRGSADLQFNLISILSAEQIPERGACLQYLLRRFEHFRPEDQTFDKFLSAMHHQGFPISQDFAEGFDFTTLRHVSEPPANVPVYKVHYCESFSHESLPDVADFENTLKDCILYHGGVLSEFKVRDGFTAEGNGTGDFIYVDVGERGPTQGANVAANTSRKRQRGGVDGPTKRGRGGRGAQRGRGGRGAQRGRGRGRGGKGMRPLGHAILIIGWETIDGELHFDYLNTAGPTWGFRPYVGFPDDIRGYGRIRSGELHHVYVPQIVKQQE